MKHKLYSFLKWFLVLALVLAAGVCYSCGGGRETVSLQTYEEEGVAGAMASGAAGLSAAGTERTADSEAAVLGTADSGTTVSAVPEAVCYVHICGAVVNPGVYEIAEGQRIYQAVEQAGGYTQDAAADYLNLAGPVRDGMKLVVPTREELLAEPAGSLYGTGASQEAGTGEAARVNLNTATKEELMSLSGIGEARAGDIIRYREEHGGFRQIEDIMKVPGIKEAAFQKIKDEATV